MKNGSNGLFVFDVFFFCKQCPFEISFLEICGFVFAVYVVLCSRASHYTHNFFLLLFVLYNGKQKLLLQTYFIRYLNKLLKRWFLMDFLQF
jgi:hypothetical protein